MSIKLTTLKDKDETPDFYTELAKELDITRQEAKIKYFQWSYNAPMSLHDRLRTLRTLSTRNLIKGA